MIGCAVEANGQGCVSLYFYCDIYLFDWRGDKHGKPRHRQQKRDPWCYGARSLQEIQANRPVDAHYCIILDKPLQGDKNTLVFSQRQPTMPTESILCCISPVYLCFLSYEVVSLIILNFWRATFPSVYEYFCLETGVHEFERIADRSKQSYAVIYLCTTNVME